MGSPNHDRKTNVRVYREKKDQSVISPCGALCLSEIQFSQSHIVFKDLRAYYEIRIHRSSKKVKMFHVPLQQLLQMSDTPSFLITQ